jgi:deoxyadenosine/deoxycytidine kinase
MKMIIIYGPPGVGKLTVSKHLALKTKFKLFHNHLTTDLIASLFKIWSDPFLVALDDVRIFLFTMAANNNLDIIFTFVYESGTKDRQLKKYIDIYEKKGGTVYLIQLTASQDALKCRISEPDRKKYFKLYGTDALESYLKKINPFLQVPQRNSLVIDNTNLSADAVVKKIMASCNLVSDEDTKNINLPRTT